MKNCFEDIRDDLYERFKELNLKYKPEKNVEIYLHIYPESEIKSGGHMFFKEKGGIYIYDIMLFINEKDKDFEPLRVRIKRLEDYCRYILFHEYGHYRYLEIVRKKDGVRKMLQEYEDYFKDRERLESWAKRNKIDPILEQKRYREIKFEKKADDFAQIEYSIFVQGKRGGI